MQLLDRASRHPIVAALVLAGSVAAGMTAVTGAGRALFDHLLPEETAFRVCPILSQPDCLRDNIVFAEFLDTREAGDILPLDLRIDWGGLDRRADLCPSDALDGLPPDLFDPMPDTTVIAVPTSDRTCDSALYLAFDTPLLDGARIAGGGGGTAYRLNGTFTLIAEELSSPDLPTASYLGIWRLRLRDGTPVTD